MIVMVMTYLNFYSNNLCLIESAFKIFFLIEIQLNQMIFVIIFMPAINSKKMYQSHKNHYCWVGKLESSLDCLDPIILKKKSAIIGKIRV